MSLRNPIDDRPVAIVSLAAIATCFVALFFFTAAELRLANGRLARAEHARTIAREALSASLRAELDDLRARRDRGALPPMARRGMARR